MFILDLKKKRPVWYKDSFSLSLYYGTLPRRVEGWNVRLHVNDVPGAHVQGKRAPTHLKRTGNQKIPMGQYYTENNNHDVLKVS